MGRGIRRRYAQVSNLIRLSVRYDSVLSTLSISLALIFSCVLSSDKGALLWIGLKRGLKNAQSMRKSQNLTIV